MIAEAVTGDLVRVPSSAAVAADHLRQVDAVLAVDGAIQGRFVDKRTGEQLAEAIALFRNQPKTEYTRGVEQWIGSSIPGANTSGIDAQSGGAEFVLTGQFSSAHFAQRPQPGMLLFHAGLLRHNEVRFSEKTRKYSIVLNTDALQETVRIELPKEFKLDELPRSIHLDTEFGRFDVTWQVRDGVLVFQRTLEMRAQTVPTARYQDSKKFLDAVSSAEDAPVVLVK